MAGRKLIAYIRVNPLAKSLMSLPSLPASLSTLQKYRKDVILCSEGRSIAVVDIDNGQNDIDRGDLMAKSSRYTAIALMALGVAVFLWITGRL